jgi:ABC-type polysaccharide/polyol phosphate transport system ATPase subunit
MTSALRVGNVSKQYRIYDRPGDRLKESLSRGRLRRHREFWALRDINFEIEAGTTVGLIGQNGCGKSTLLQIISGTLTPTHGQVWHDGRIAALLELGAGFDPEFTGVENVYMNASLMGFSRRETKAIFPHVERFAEIGQFIHQPVKTYSSGMYVRLAFAVAASVEPDILIIDEALAVGDAVFQHRCLRRLKELHERGATILFVSHDTAAVRALCDRAILLNAGRMIADGTPTDVLHNYQRIVMEREEAYDAGTVQNDQTDTKPPLAPVHYTYRHGDGSAESGGVFFSREDDAANFGLNLGNFPIRSQPVHFGHVDIEQDEVRMMFLSQLQSLQTIRGNRNHFHIVYGCEHQAGVAACFLNIIGDEHPHLVFRGDISLGHLVTLIFYE